jgi:cytochrome o ubiquinol oxidase subunit IV
MKHDSKETSYSTRNYVIGFGLSLALTLLAYLFVQRHLASHHAFLSDNTMLFMLTLLALSQLVIQLLYFLHLGREPKPRWNFLVFCFMLGMVLTLVFGSLWIMHNLNYHMPPADKVDQYLRSQDGL